jgi:uncharacterized protein (DUF2147 family)
MRPSILILALAALPMLAAAEASPVGRWKTIDDESGKVKSIVEISAAGNVHTGRVLQVLHSTRGPNPKCDQCKGANAGKPIEGLTILWGLTPGSDGWDGGNILDPANGKTYKAKARLLEGGRKLGVSGCVAFICREQVWIRE